MSRRSTVLSITSGKGGVGKTMLTCNLALALSERQRRVLIFDGDLSMASVDIMFGVRPRGNIFDVIQGRKSIEDIVIQVAPSVFVMPGGNGVFELSQLNHFERRFLLESMQALPLGIDYFLIDTAPGIDEEVMYLNSSAQIVTVVVTPDPASFTDAYSLIKVLNQRHKVKKFQIVCNMVKTLEEGFELYKKLSEIVSRFLDVGLGYFGAIPFDESLKNSVQQQRLILRQNPQAPSAQGIYGISLQIERKHLRQHQDGIQDFWEQVVGMNP